MTLEQFKRICEQVGQYARDKAEYQGLVDDIISKCSSGLRYSKLVPVRVKEWCNKTNKAVTKVKMTNYLLPPGGGGEKSTSPERAHESVEALDRKFWVKEMKLWQPIVEHAANEVILLFTLNNDNEKMGERLAKAILDHCAKWTIDEIEGKRPNRKSKLADAEYLLKFHSIAIERPCFVKYKRYFVDQVFWHMNYAKMPVAAVI